MNKTLVSIMVIGLGSACAKTMAGIPMDLKYPAVGPTALEVAEQVFFVNHFYAVENLFIEGSGEGKHTVLVTRESGRKPITTLLRRYLNNDVDDADVQSRDMAFFKMGAKITGMLITDFEDENRGQSYAVYFPRQKKVRRFAQPPHDNFWGGSDFTFGDVYLRRPWHEDHELLGTMELGECLGVIKLSEKARKNPKLKNLPGPQCNHKGKPVYQLKSTTKFKNWWYDYRVSYVDVDTFADYRTEYFKGDAKIKIIDRDWVSMGLNDPRAQYWNYWYGRNLETGHETMVNTFDSLVTWNKVDTSVKGGGELWSEETLKKIAGRR